MSREGGLEHLTLKPRIRTILTGWERNQDWRFEQAKDRLAAANDAIRTTRTFFFALLSTRLTSAPSSPARPGGVEFQRAGMLTEVRRGRREPRPTTKAVGSPASEGARSRLERFAPIDCPLPALALAHLPAPSLLPLERRTPCRPWHRPCLALDLPPRALQHRKAGSRTTSTSEPTQRAFSPSRSATGPPPSARLNLRPSTSRCSVT